jgi:hypothetical protein
MKRLAILFFSIAAAARAADPDRRAILTEFSDSSPSPNLASDAPNSRSRHSEHSEPFREDLRGCFVARRFVARQR